MSNTQFSAGKKNIAKPAKAAGSKKTRAKRGVPAEKAEKSAVVKKDEVLKHASLMDFINPLYFKQKLNKSYRDSFKEIVPGSSGAFVPLSQRDRKELLELALKKDPDHKVTLELAELLLERSGNPKLQDYLLSYVEFLVSHTGNLKNLGKASIFQEWIDASGVSRHLDFLCDQIDQIKDGLDAKGQPKIIGEKVRNNLKCIAAIWLYLKGKVSFQSMIEQLSGRAFSLKGETCDEARAVGFIAAMVGSTKKQSFAHYFNYQKNYEQALRAEIDQGKSEKLNLSEQIFKQKSTIQDLKNQLVNAGNEKQQLNQTIADLQQQLSETKTEASHQGIHQRDELNLLRSKLSHVLEDDLLVNLESARVANSRTPPKTRVIDIKLEDIIEQVREQIEWLKR